MEFGTKMEELEMTAEEVERFTKALKDERFREMLHEYADEISKPENKKKYEEEITQLEQERGMEVKFIHPDPHHVLKTSVDGKEKGFINVCSNTLINKATCVPGRAENGQVGQCWSLPYTLTPGRPDRDKKGKNCTVYDVVFHPDMLHIAAKNPRLMKLVNDTAVQAVEGAFKVKLDRSNVKTLKMQYKGALYAAVLRKPIPGHCAQETEDSLPIPHQETVRDNDGTNDSSLPTQPNYTITYRSMVDLQDYRNNRDSAPSPRPREIVVTIDLPLLKSAADVDLDVTEKTLTLESRKPAYKLELKLSYPVDDERGDAKFNKAKKQLIVTLSVKPSKEQVPCGPWGNLLDNNAEHPDKVEENVDQEEAALAVEPHVNDGDKHNEQISNRFCHTEEDLGAHPDFLILNENDESLPHEMTNDTPGLQCKTMTGVKTGVNICTTNAPCEHDISEDGTLKDEGVHLSHVGSMLSSNTAPITPPHTTQHPKNLVLPEISHPAEQQRQESVPPGGAANQPTLLEPTAVYNCVLATPAVETELSAEDEREHQCSPGHEDLDSAVRGEPSRQRINTAVVLRERNTDGSETLIRDHTTAAALSFQNSLWFELD